VSEFWQRQNISATLKFMFPRSLLYICWIVSLACVAGSLFFSEILKLPPCELCWYQRIFIYPLALMLPIGIVRQDLNIRLYALALLVPGSIISIYHNLIYYDLIEKPLTPCKAGVSCTDRSFEFFGFIGIPLMSLVAFLVMIVLILVCFKKEKKS
jgi:disulfide bond formation protein DsbB